MNEQLLQLKEQVKDKLYTRMGKKQDFWRVLDIDLEKEQILLISEKCLVEGKFDEPYKGYDSTWDKCDLRKWLNNEFYAEYFTDEEKFFICDSVNIARNNMVENTDAGKDTIDKVFLLDIDEAKEYFLTDEDRACCKEWVLRSPGEDPKHQYLRHSYLNGTVATVKADGQIDLKGEEVQHRFNIRPTIRISYKNYSMINGSGFIRKKSMIF